MSNTTDKAAPFFPYTASRGAIAIALCKTIINLYDRDYPNPKHLFDEAKTLENQLADAYPATGDDKDGRFNAAMTLLNYLTNDYIDFNGRTEFEF